MTAHPNSTLAHAARELAAEIREGKWRHVAELGVKSASECEEIVAELRSRYPGLERAEYEKEIGVALAAYRPPPARDAYLFWFIGLTFLWGFFVINFLLKRYGSDRHGWIGIFTYPTVCVGAAFYLCRSNRSGRWILAAINVASGISWIVFLSWAAQAFAKSFWR